MRAGRTLENIVKVGIVLTGITFAAAMGFSLYRPAGRGASLPTRQNDLGGPVIRVNSPHEQIETAYAGGSIYPSDISDFADEGKRSRFKPSVIRRYEANTDMLSKNEDQHKSLPGSSTSTTLYVERAGQRARDIVVTSGRNYTVQFDCPPNFKSIQVAYCGIALDTRTFKDKTGNWFIVKSNLDARLGSQSLTAVIEYPSGSKHEYDVTVVGIPKK